MKRNFHSKRLLFLLSALFLMLDISAEVKLPRLISNGMVLQRDTPLQLWGWASPGETVAVTFQEKKFSTKADKQGNWKIVLPAYSAGGSYTMQINHISISDILIGEVWLCSGQSNMELPLRRTMDLYKSEIEATNNPHIRLFRTPLHYNFKQEETDLQGGEWKAAIPANITEFSAVAYFFAKNIYDTYNIPVGIISTAVGGSPAEAWISKDALKNYPQYLSTLALTVNDTYVDSIRKTESEQSEKWHTLLNKNDKGVSVWNNDNTDTSSWSSVSLPGYWSDKGLEKICGSIWLRKEFTLPETMTEQTATLRLGCIVDSDSAFVNGIFVGTTSYQYPPRIYNIPAGILRKGTNNITIRTVCNGGRGGFVEDKPYKIIIGKEEVDLTGDWKYRLGAQMAPAPSQTFFQYKPAGLFNGTIAPLTNYAIRGFLWYQGESNSQKPAEYKLLMTDLIGEWRKRWNTPQMPFIYAQLPNFMTVKKEPAQSDWAELRESQRQLLSIPNTGMAVTIDLGEWNDIHPLNKKGVAQRLFLEARRVAYADTTATAAPRYERMKVERNSIILIFSSTGKGLYTNLKLGGFAIAGSDKKYVWANAAFLPDNKIRVWSNQVQHPVSVRYAWADNPSDANLRNKEGIPASPFCTDSE